MTSEINFGQTPVMASDSPTPQVSENNSTSRTKAIYNCFARNEQFRAATSKTAIWTEEMGIEKSRTRLRTFLFNALLGTMERGLEYVGRAAWSVGRIVGVIYGAGELGATSVIAAAKCFFSDKTSAEKACKNVRKSREDLIGRIQLLGLSLLRIIAEPVALIPMHLGSSFVKCASEQMGEKGLFWVSRQITRLNNWEAKIVNKIHNNEKFALIYDPYDPASPNTPDSLKGKKPPSPLCKLILEQAYYNIIILVKNKLNSFRSENFRSDGEESSSKASRSSTDSRSISEDSRSSYASDIPTSDRDSF